MNPFEENLLRKRRRIEYLKQAKDLMVSDMNAEIAQAERAFDDEVLGAVEYSQLPKSRIAEIAGYKTAASLRDVERRVNARNA